MFTADRLIALAAALALLFLMGRRLPGRLWPVVLAATLGLVVLVVLAEQNGLWPRGWTTR
jgi:hypothetical protein